MISKQRRDEAILDNPIAEVFPDDPPEQVTNKDQDKFDILAKQIADLQTENANLARQQMALLSNPNWQSENNFQPQLEDPNKIKLVDPALDPDGYANALAQRTRIENDNARKTFDADNRRQLTVKERADNLKAAFAEKYPHLVDDEDSENRIDFISTRVAQAAQKRGVNVERYMFQTTDKFVDDVAKQYIKTFGEPETGEEDFEDNFEDHRPAPRARSKPASRRRNRQEDDNVVSRTSGIFGGSESGGRPGRTVDEETGGGMIEDIHAIQKKSGFW